MKTANLIAACINFLLASFDHSGLCMAFGLLSLAIFGGCCLIDAHFAEDALCDD